MSGTGNGPHAPGAVCPGQRPAPRTGVGATPPGPRTPEGFKVGTNTGQDRGGPSGLTLSSHGAAGGCRDTHQGPELRSNSLAGTEREKNPPTARQTRREGRPQVHSHSPRQHPGDHSVEPPTPGRNLCTARPAAWMGPHPQPRGHSGGRRTKSHLATSVEDTRSPGNIRACWLAFPKPTVTPPLLMDPGPGTRRPLLLTHRTQPAPRAETANT